MVVLHCSALGLSALSGGPSEVWGSRRGGGGSTLGSFIGRGENQASPLRKKLMKTYEEEEQVLIIAKYKSIFSRERRERERIVQ